MRIPDPIANTTTEAYLAYKAGVLAEGDLKPKLYDPYIHLDAWLAYWAGLTTTYPVKNVGKNLFRGGNPDYTGQSAWASYGNSDYTIVDGGYNLPDRYTAIAFEYDNLVVGEEYTFSADYVGNASFYFSVGVNMYSGGSSLPHSYTDYGAKTTSQRLSFKFTASATNRIGFNSGYTSGNTLTLTNIQLERSSTATAYEPYTGEPEMLTDEEALIAYLSGVTDTYPEEFRDPDDVRVAAYLKYLVSARWGRPEYPVTNEELYLSMMDAPYIPAGEPSSDIEIDDTAEAPFKDVKMYGDTSQTTYTGKNLLKLTPQASTSNGITATLSDGIIKYSGTASSNWANIAARTYNAIPAGDYMLSMQETFPANYAFALSVTYTDNTTANFECWQSVDNKRTVTFAKDVASFCVYLTGLSSGSSYSGTISLMLEAGSTATSFEPYVGGVPAPNPDYPQAVNTVTGRQMVKVEGKNLLDSSSENITQKFNCTTEDVDNGIKVNGTSSGTLHYATLNITGAERLLGQEVTITCNYAGSASSRVSIYYIKSGGQAWTYINELTNNDGVASKTFTMPNSLGDNIGIGLVLYTGGNESSIFTNLQIEKGSTATDFTPYQSAEYEIDLGKNLLDNTLQATTTYAGTTTTIDGSTWTVVKTANGGISLTPRTDFLPVNIKAGESVTFSSYPVSGVVTQSSVHYQIRCYFYDKDENLLDNISSTTTANYIMAQAWSTSYTPTVDVAYIKLGYYVPSNAGTTDGVTLHLQLERGSQATSYAPYFTPIELCKIGDYQDYIYENEGKWYVHKATGEYTFTSSETVSYQSNFPRFMVNFSHGQDATAGVAGLAKSTHFVVGQTASVDGTFGIAASVIYLHNEAITSGDDLKTWFSNNNVSVYFALATATDTEITNTALIDQLNALKNGGSYTGTTYIKVSATDPNLPGLLKVEAYKYD